MITYVSLSRGIVKKLDEYICLSFRNCFSYISCIFFYVSRDAKHFTLHAELIFSRAPRRHFDFSTLKFLSFRFFIFIIIFPIFPRTRNRRSVAEILSAAKKLLNEIFETHCGCTLNYKYYYRRASLD